MASPESEHLTANHAGDTSVHSFLARVSAHLAVTGQGLPRNLLERADHDLDNESLLATSVILPPRDTSIEYMECYLQHAHVTYRYVPRSQIEQLIDRAYDEDATLLHDDEQMALLMLVLAIGYDQIGTPTL